MSNWFNPINWINGDKLEYNILSAIPKTMFILLYAIDKDLLVLGICAKIRELRLEENLDLNNVLEDAVGRAVNEIIWAKVTVTKAEARAFGKALGENMADATAPALAKLFLNKEK